jgi:hypothetical protein
MRTRPLKSPPVGDYQTALDPENLGIRQSVSTGRQIIVSGLVNLMELVFPVT